MKFMALTLLIWSSVNYAAGTPFDGFFGEYKVTKQNCIDLNVPLRELTPRWKEIHFKEGQKEGTVRIVSHVDGSVLEETLAKDETSEFSGNGLTDALWRTQRFERELEIDVWKSLKVFPKGVISFSWLRKFYVTRPKHYENGHNYCQFELVGK